MTATKNFGWQGLRLRVPEEWNLGKVDGDAKSGYARLDDAEIVRAEIEWRTLPLGGHVTVEDLVDRYIAQLQKKAKKADLDFSCERRARFLTDKRWLEGASYETFIWEADFRAYNLAKRHPTSNRVVLMRVLAKHDEPTSRMAHLADEIFRSLEDEPRDGHGVYWGIYGLDFEMPGDFGLQEHQLRSGHIRLSFERGTGRDQHVVQVHRVSMAQMLLQDTDLATWYRSFFHKELKELKIETTPAVVQAGGGEHEGLIIDGAPRSRFRMLLRPLPLVNPRPRRHLHAVLWHCEEANRICLVEHLYRKQQDEEGLVDTLIRDYVCHTEETEADARGDAELAAGPQ
ncbi:MAG: hypothetical protein HN712_17510 [Gemmatimonadetes bacterium]|nr:hypothetical protein [Gemmatimonadota bacterium]MBT6149176.1 hypothetical protein [Gemmatimonadota bacterium]MBT7862118.1 hypothetical protein [Gemmatimonadota bacterium]